MRTKNEEMITKVKDFLEEYYGAHGAAPTVREIAAELGCGKSSAQSYLKELESRGLARRTMGGYRTELTDKMNERIVQVPVLGGVPCGPLSEEYENVEGYVPMPATAVGGGRYYFLTARGRSMVNAGIDDGDLVLIKAQSTANDGDIVVALVENEVTLKRLFRDRVRRRVVLHPENDEMSDIYADGCEIQGIAVKVIKDLRYSAY